MALSVTPNLPVIAPTPAAGGATSSVVLQPGTVVNAEVLKVADNLVQIAIANLAIDVLSEVPLVAGQSLQLAVSKAQDGSVKLAIVGQGAEGAGPASAASTNGLVQNAQVNAAPSAAASAAPPPNDPLTPPERAAVSVASESAASQQQSLAPLFANLASAVASNNLSPALASAINEVLARQTSLDPNLSGADIEAAFQKSGLFLEASLTSPDALPAAGVPDLKAALIVLRQALASTVDGESSAATPSPAAAASGARPSAGTVSSPTLAPSLSSTIGHDILPPLANLPGAMNAAAGNSGQIVLTEALLNEPASATQGAALQFVQEALQEIPRAAVDAAIATVTLPGGSSEEVILRTSTPPPPFRGALPSPQPVAAPSIPPGAPLATIAHKLLDNTDAALARQTLLQVASLPGRVDATSSSVDPTAPRWNFEIPFATAQGTAMAQFEISRDGGGREVEAAKRVWRARFTLDVEPAGPVHALVTLSGERTSVRMWAERPQTAARLRAGAAELSQALSRAELSPGDIVVRDGTPPQVVPAKAGHFLDRAL
jgi:Flagellar hook-length control protein FliK